MIDRLGLPPGINCKCAMSALGYFGAIERSICTWINVISLYSLCLVFYFSSWFRIKSNFSIYSNSCAAHSEWQHCRLIVNAVNWLLYSKWHIDTLLYLVFVFALCVQFLFLCLCVRFSCRNRKNRSSRGERSVRFPFYPTRINLK